MKWIVYEKLSCMRSGDWKLKAEISPTLILLLAVVKDVFALAKTHVTA